MAGTYAEVADVTKRWARTPTTAEQTLIETRLEDAERMIERGLRRRGLTTLAQRILSGLTDEEDVKQVEADVVLRLVRNPDGYLSETDGNYTYMVSQDLATGKLAILPEDWETLGVVDATGMFVIVPTPVMSV